MRFHNFWCISFLASEFLNHVQKTPKSWEKICSITIFHQDPEKTLLQAWKPLKIAFFLPTSLSDNHGQKSWDTFAFLGRFPIHTGPTPPLTPQTMLDACIQNFFRVSTLYRVGGGRTARKFRKRCTVLRGNREITENMNIAVLSQGLLSRIVAMKSGQVREGKSNTAGSPFLPRRKESTAIAWSIAHQ